MQAGMGNLGLPCCLQEQRAYCLCLSSLGKWAVPLKYLHASISFLFLTATGSEDFCYAVQRGGACPRDQQRIQQADAHASPSKHKGNCMPGVVCRTCASVCSWQLVLPLVHLGVNWKSRASHRYSGHRLLRHTHSVLTTSEHGNFISSGYN